MDSEDRERLELVTERLSQMRQDNRDPFWEACFGAAAGEASDEAFLHYGVCRRIFGHRLGTCLCVLYAQLCECRELTGGKGSAGGEEYSGAQELVLTSRELLAMLCRMYIEHSGAAQMRDELFWFYHDYARLILDVLVETVRVDGGCRLMFGGPMLFGSGLITGGKTGDEHRHDCGLYLGSRWVRQFDLALSDIAKAQDPETGKALALLQETAAYAVQAVPAVPAVPAMPFLPAGQKGKAEKTEKAEQEGQKEQEKQAPQKMQASLEMPMSGRSPETGFLLNTHQEELLCGLVRRMKERIYI